MACTWGTEKLLWGEIKAVRSDCPETVRRLAYPPNFATLENRVDDLGKLLSQEGRNDARRSLGGAQTKIVGSAGNGGTEHARVAVDTPEDGSEDEEEAVVGLGLDGGVEQVVAEVGGWKGAGR